jgi:hypothetical protein
LTWSFYCAISCGFIHEKWSRRGIYHAR